MFYANLSLIDLLGDINLNDFVLFFNIQFVAILIKFISTYLFLPFLFNI